MERVKSKSKGLYFPLNQLLLRVTLNLEELWAEACRHQYAKESGKEKGFLLLVYEVEYILPVRDSQATLGHSTAVLLRSSRFKFKFKSSFIVIRD
nr:hypothetical protein [Tanacetum cinerariifolium]